MVREVIDPRNNVTQQIQMDEKTVMEIAQLNDGESLECLRETRHHQAIPVDAHQTLPGKQGIASRGRRAARRGGGEFEEQSTVHGGPIMRVDKRYRPARLSIVVDEAG